MGGQHHAPAASPLGKTRYLLYNYACAVAKTLGRAEPCARGPVGRPGDTTSNVNTYRNSEQFQAMSQTCRTNNHSNAMTHPQMGSLKSRIS
jgi:hypothetical protein